MAVELRDTTPTDLAALQALYADAFPDEELWPLVQALFGCRDVVSLGAYDGDTLIGHACVTMCGLEGQSVRLGLLGPVGVLSGYQRQGVGRALIEESMARLALWRGLQMQVLGDPAYYGASGFVADPNVAPPYELPREWATAWQVRRVDAHAPTLRGKLWVPDQWRDPALWSP